MFRFRQFSVNHDRSSMKVGTDAVLLGAWSNLPVDGRVLDVGTGCGVIALMVAQRTPLQVHIDAIDIDGPSVEEATQNFAVSPWLDRIAAHQVDVNDFASVEPYDCIVTNPPYFTEDVLPPDAVRSAARHTHSLTFDRLMRNAARLLTADGTISLITPVEARDGVTAAATFAGLHLARVTTVFSTERGSPKRLLWQWDKRPCATLRDDLIIHLRSGEYSPQYTALCCDFYLKF